MTSGIYATNCCQSFINWVQGDFPRNSSQATARKTCLLAQVFFLVTAASYLFGGSALALPVGVLTLLGLLVVFRDSPTRVQAPRWSHDSTNCCLGARTFTPWTWLSSTNPVSGRGGDKPAVGGGEVLGRGGPVPGKPAVGSGKVLGRGEPAHRGKPTVGGGEVLGRGGAVPGKPAVGSGKVLDPQHGRGGGGKPAVGGGHLHH